MTSQIRTSATDELYADLVDLLARQFVSTADRARIDRLAKIVGRRENIDRTTVLYIAGREALGMGA